MCTSGSPLLATGLSLWLGCTPKTDSATEPDAIAKALSELEFASVSWADEGPLPREHGAMAVSDDGGTLFLHGGGGYPNAPSQPMYNDSWRLDVGSEVWSRWAVSGDVPPPGASRRAARASGDIVYLHGGYLDGFVTSDALYRLDLDSGVFTEVLQSTPRPPTRSLHAFVFDEMAQQFVVFGGYHADNDGGAVLGDTWIGALTPGLDIVDWTEVTSVGPSPRYGAFAGLDAHPARLIVFSGAGAPTATDPINASDDVWALSLGEAPAWTPLVPTGEGPVGRRNGCGIVDPLTRGLFVFGGTADGATTARGAYLLDLEAGEWLSAPSTDAPVPRSSGFGAALPNGGFVCGFGNDADVHRDVFFLR